MSSPSAALSPPPSFPPSCADPACTVKGAHPLHGMPAPPPPPQEVALAEAQAASLESELARRQAAASPAVDHVVQAGRWRFDEEVTESFDDMLRRSIPLYAVMRDLVLEVGARYVQHQTDVVDLGCSRGGAIAKMVDRFGAHNRFVGVEVSPPMLAAARSRFQGYINVGVVDIQERDLRHSYPPVRASLTLAVLTLQFTPIEHRLRILADVHRHTLPGGAFILVEKVLGSSADIDARLVELYLDHKRAMGYSEEEIERKRHALEGVLVPVTARWNEELLRGAGFNQVDCFWRHLNFAAWLAVK